MTNQIQDIISKLHPLERRLLPHLVDGIDFKDLIAVSGMKDVEVMRCLQWLTNKLIVALSESKKELIRLDANGLIYSKVGLPEVRLLKTLSRTDWKSADALKIEASLSDQEFSISLGTLKGKAAIDTDKPNGILGIKLSDNGLKLLNSESLETRFLKGHFPKVPSSMSPEERFAFDNLMKRRQIVKLDVEKVVVVRLTEFGSMIISSLSMMSLDYEENLTKEMLKSGAWKGKRFRHYDIHINVPKIDGAKRHFVRQSMDYIRKVWLELGFKEMEGTMVQSAFWDLDCLFVPQDHPARTMQDTFYIKDPARATLQKSLVKKIKAVHENGADTGSRGWGGNWSEDEASLNLLRTHTTVLSARTIAGLKKEDLPAKFFSVNKVFRNETLTWKHLFELHQVEGIVIDPNATLAHLKGYLTEFYKKLGYEKVRMRPAHFPYTEPSLEVDVFHPEKKEWVELGGAGIFRPEVVKTLLGIDVPVLAWGQGLERGIMGFYGFKDIRQLYNNDLKELRQVKIWR